MADIIFLTNDNLNLKEENDFMIYIPIIVPIYTACSKFILLYVLCIVSGKS